MYVCFKMVVLQHNKYILTFVRKKVAKSSVYKKGQKYNKTRFNIKIHMYYTVYIYS